MNSLKVVDGALVVYFCDNEMCCTCSNANMIHLFISFYYSSFTTFHYWRLSDLVIATVNAQNLSMTLEIFKDAPIVVDVGYLTAQLAVPC